jgi:hypothetical protein
MKTSSAKNHAAMEAQKAYQRRHGGRSGMAKPAGMAKKVMAGRGGIRAMDAGWAL